VVFPKTVGLELISAQRAMNEAEAGATCFMIVAQTEKKSIVEKISMILVVDEYADVFPDEILKLPPSRDVDFTIDLIPGAGPVSMAPYRMTPVTKHIFFQLAKFNQSINGWTYSKKKGTLSQFYWGVQIYFLSLSLPSLRALSFTLAATNSSKRCSEPSRSHSKHSYSSTTRSRCSFSLILYFL